MTFIWLIIWLLAGQDPITFAPAVNDWATALLVCAALDVSWGGVKG